VFEFADKILISAVLKRRLLQQIKREIEGSFCFYIFAVLSRKTVSVVCELAE